MWYLGCEAGCFGLASHLSSAHYREQMLSSRGGSVACVRPPRRLKILYTTATHKEARARIPRCAAAAARQLPRSWWRSAALLGSPVRLRRRLASGAVAAHQPAGNMAAGCRRAGFQSEQQTSAVRAREGWRLIIVGDHTVPGEAGRGTKTQDRASRHKHDNTASKPAVREEDHAPQRSQAARSASAGPRNARATRPPRRRRWRPRPSRRGAAAGAGSAAAAPARRARSGAVQS